MSLSYNIRWIDNTFTTNHITNSLLTPQKDNGVLSQADFERASAFFPGIHRYYRLIGSAIPVPIVLARRRPGWSNIRTYTIATLSSTLGFLIGNAFALNAHFRFVHSIQDPAAFSEALTNIHAQLGKPYPPSPVILRHFDESSGNNPASDPITFSTLGPPETSPTSAAPNSSTEKSKWDQIRTANTAAASPSSWDALRQRHEKQRVASSSTPSQDEDRAAEQARFDALVEKERNIK